jgi:hypothetical protein
LKTKVKPFLQYKRKTKSQLKTFQNSIGFFADAHILENPYSRIFLLTRAAMVTPWSTNAVEISKQGFWIIE